MHREFDLPSRGRIDGRTSSITAAFFQAITPVIPPSDAEVEEAIAVLGMVMVKAFSSRLTQSVTHLALPPEVVREIKMNENRLAGLQVPGVDSKTKIAIKESVGKAFVFGFRMVMLICAGLSVASAGVASRMIPQTTSPGRTPESRG